MDSMYRLKPEQVAVIAQVREIAERVIAPNAASVDAKEAFPHESFAALGGAGFLGLTVPVEYGGMGQGLRVACAVLDELAQRCPSTAMIYMMHLAGIACYTAASETSAPLLRAAAKGEHLSTLAWSERGSGSYFWVPVSREIRENGHVRPTAEKSFVTAAESRTGTWYRLAGRARRTRRSRCSIWSCDQTKGSASTAAGRAWGFEETPVRQCGSTT